MEEESLRFWIIPIISIVIVAMFFVTTMDYKYNTTIPNAILEKGEIEDMSCQEIETKIAGNHYWSTENANLVKEKNVICNPPSEIKSSGGDPYIDFCKPGGFAPIKVIQNNTHSFNHDTCIWDLK